MTSEAASCYDDSHRDELRLVLCSSNPPHLLQKGGWIVVWPLSRLAGTTLAIAASLGLCCDPLIHHISCR